MDAAADDDVILDPAQIAVQIATAIVVPGGVPLTVQQNDLTPVVLNRLLELTFHVLDVAVVIRLAVQEKTRTAVSVGAVIILIPVQQVVLYKGSSTLRNGRK